MAVILLAGLFGLLIGSFLNVCIYRLPRDLSVVTPRSFCPGCEQQIAWYDNVPVLSYLILSGRCRNCGTAISPRYPLVEFITGCLFMAGVAVFGPTVSAAQFCVFAAIQTVLIFTDLEERLLPDEFTLGGIVAGLSFAAFVPPPSAVLSFFLPDSVDWRIAGVAESAFAAAALGGVLWLTGALYHRIRGREGLGFGDVKMVACIGAFLGPAHALLAIAGGSLLGSITGLTYILLAGKQASTYQLPFGSFLGVAAIAVALIRPTDYAL